MNTRSNKIIATFHERGFTLVELVVVIGIISILSILSATAFISAKKQFSVDSATEELLSNIREVQNRSISVMNDADGNDTKVWGIRISQNGYSLDSYYPNSDSLAPTSLLKYDELPKDDSSVSYPPGVNATLEVLGDATATEGYVFYSSPFGKSYLAKTAMLNNPSDVSKCEWTNLIGTKETPAKDYFPNSICTGYASTMVNNNQLIRVVISNNSGNRNTIVIKSNGEAYIER